MESTRVNHLLSFRMLFVFITLLLLFVHVGCDNNNDNSGNISTLDTGTVSFNVVWNQSSDIGTDYQTRAVICGNDPVQVSTVSAAITNSDVSITRMGGPWDCNPPEGIIQGVPVGSGYILFFYGHNEAGRTTYSATKLGISVSAGPNYIGTLDVNQFFAEISSPSDASSDIDPDDATFSWSYASGAAKYQLWIAETSDLSDPLIYETTDLFFTVPVGNLSADTTYYWTVFPIDIYENRSQFYSDIYSFMTASGGTITDDNYEDNDTKETAFDLSYWDGLNLSSYNGEGVAVFDDFDYYRIEVPYTSATIEIVCTFSHESGDIDVELIDTEGVVLESGVSSNDDEIITYYHSGSPQTTYFIKVWRYGDVDTNPNQYDLIWYAFPFLTLDANLTAYQSTQNGSFSVSNNNLNWGQNLDIRWAVINDGSAAIPAGTDASVSFYLSANNLITYLDYELFTVILNPLFSDGLSSGSSIYGTDIVTLPSNPALADLPESGEFYIGMIIDLFDGFMESDEYDNSNQGEGLDVVPVNISP